ncbi:NTP transferase domain-containing protein [candidate division KSB1 bacterium]|nr:NTP transferase domain-containing protein [candidate division KSB1 bacterium]
MKNAHAVVMAGGAGTRFWPKSRESIPKQFLSLLGSQTLLQAAFERVRQFIPKNQTWIVSTKDHQSLLAEQIKSLSESHFILEPFGKNTAPCIALASLIVHQHDPDSVLIVLPADHIITNEKRFINICKKAVSLVEEHPDALVTIGIEPSYPATGYGYIQLGKKVPNFGEAFKVKTFAEKPDLEVAQKFYLSDEFLWNSGIFVWRTRTILNYFEELMPDLYDGLMEIRTALNKKNYDKVLERVYRQTRSESIDYGIMEKAGNVMVVKGGFGWSDVGSWDEVYKISSKDSNGNVLKGDIIAKDVSNTYAEASDRMIALVGVKHLVVVDMNDVILICERDQAQDVKWVVEKLKRQKRNQLL